MAFVKTKVVAPNRVVYTTEVDSNASLQILLDDLTRQLDLDPQKYKLEIVLESVEMPSVLDRNTNDSQPALQIYHLSDLHFPHERIVDAKYSFGENYDSQIGSQPHEVFEQFLQKQTDRAGNLSKLIIVSGDLARHAAYEELEEAVGFIAHVASMFRTAVPDEQVIVVPGNHDVNWKIAEDSKHFSEKFDTFKSRFHDADRKFVLGAVALISRRASNKSIGG